MLVSETPEDHHARQLLVEKYRKGNELDEWGRTSLPIAIDFKATEDAQSAE